MVKVYRLPSCFDEELVTERYGAPANSNQPTIDYLMNLLLRWKTCVVSSFEHVVNQLENHEAVVDTAIREAREAAAGASIKLNRIRRDGDRMQSRILEANEAAATWASRAVQVHASDSSKALECVRRRNLALNEVRHFEAELKAHREIEQQLQRDLLAMESRIAELGRRRNAFTAREFRAKALGAAEACAAATEAVTIEDVFDRWEMKLARTEPLLSGGGAIHWKRSSSPQRNVPSWKQNWRNCWPRHHEPKPESLALPRTDVHTFERGPAISGTKHHDRAPLFGHDYAHRRWRQLFGEQLDGCFSVDALLCISGVHRIPSGGWSVLWFALEG